MLFGTMGPVLGDLDAQTTYLVTYCILVNSHHSSPCLAILCVVCLYFCVPIMQCHVLSFPLIYLLFPVSCSMFRLHLAFHSKHPHNVQALLRRAIPLAGM